MREYAFRKWIFDNARNFYRVRDIMRRISLHNWHIDIMSGMTGSGLGRQGYVEAEYRASHSNIDILCEADDICKAIGAICAAVRHEMDVYVLPRRYDLDSVSMHADIRRNGFESMIAAFEQHVSEFCITGDSEYIGLDD